MSTIWYKTQIFANVTSSNELNYGMSYVISKTFKDFSYIFNIKVYSSELRTTYYTTLQGRYQQNIMTTRPPPPCYSKLKIEYIKKSYCCYWTQHKMLFWKHKNDITNKKRKYLRREENLRTSFDYQLIQSV